MYGLEYGRELRGWDCLDMLILGLLCGSEDVGLSAYYRALIHFWVCFLSSGLMGMVFLFRYLVTWKVLIFTTIWNCNVGLIITDSIMHLCKAVPHSAFKPRTRLDLGMHQCIPIMSLTEYDM